MRTHVALLLVSILFVACDDGSPSAPGDTPLSFATVVQTSYSGFVGPQRRALHSDSELGQVWRTLHSGLTPVPALPVVDFGRETLVLAAAGTRSDGCYSIAVTRAGLSEGGVVELEVTETVPGPGCVCTQALTQPVHLIRLAHFSTRETYVERRSQLAC